MINTASAPTHQRKGPIWPSDPSDLSITWEPGTESAILWVEVMKTSRQIEKAASERLANAHAADAGGPLPFPNPWDNFDPTKVARDASPADITRSYLEFTKLCQKRPRRTHRL